MAPTNTLSQTLQTTGRAVALRTRGRQHGPIVRLVSPSDLGERLKPFVFLDHIDVELSEPVRFGHHPHSGIATLTLMIEGGFAYEDSTGKVGTMGQGSVEWMQAGRGVWHAGQSIGSRLHGYQLWVALPPALELSPPTSLYLEPTQFGSHGPARVILGEWAGVRSPIPSPGPMNYLDVALADGEAWVYEPPAGHDLAWVAVNRGRLLASEPVPRGELAIFEDGQRPISLRADGATNFVLGSAARHPHPLVLGNYSVHSSVERLDAGEDEIRRIAQVLNRTGSR